MLAFRLTLYQKASLLSLGIWLMLACQPEDDHYVYGLNQVEVEGEGAQKTQAKSMRQYIAVLHTNIFQEAINPAELQEIEEAIASIGDKTLARRMVIGSFMRNPNAKVPTMDEMREDIHAFVQETYIRFLIRQPTQAELIFMSNFIEARPQLEPHIIYTTFALSDEYQFY
ncbi:MAG: hypothetical protein AAFR87_28050 [Bacteroidota bacterium]